MSKSKRNLSQLRKESRRTIAVNKPAGDTGSPVFRSISIAVVVAVITFFVYLTSLKNAFVKWDDPDYVYNNVHIRAIDLNFFKWSFFNYYASNWHPLTWLSHAIDYAIWGLDPSGHHLTNIVLHGINTFLVILLFLQLAAVARSAMQKTPVLIGAAFTGLLFGLHPLHVESVAWVSGRKDVLSAFFFLLSLLFYIRYWRRTTEGASRRPVEGNYMLSLVFLIFALMSKPAAVVLPVVFLVVDWYPLKQFQRREWKAVLLEKVPFFFCAGLSSIITIAAQSSGGAVKSFSDYPFVQRLIIGIDAIIVYIGRMLFPSDLSPFYPHPAKVSLSSPRYLFSILLVIAVTIACIRVAKRQKIWLAVWASYVVMLIPVLGFVQVGLQATADRYTYLPSIALFVSGGVGCAFFVQHAGNGILKGTGLVIISASIILLGHLTLRQITVWKDTLSLWTRVQEYISTKDDSYYSGAYLIYYNVGAADFEENMLDEALNATRKSISLNPNFDGSHYNLGNIYLRQNRVDEAVKSYGEAIRLNPGMVDAHLNLGVAYRKQNRLPEATREFETAARLRPDYAEAHLNLGVLYMNEEKINDAVRELEKALSLKSDYVMGHLNLGVAYRKQERLDEAALQLRKALDLRPDLAEAHYELGLVYRNRARLEEAEKEFSEALRLKPGLKPARVSLDLLRNSVPAGKK